jgi:L,D-transpeptidase catalytic domain
MHVAPCDITNGILVNLPERMLFYYKKGSLEGAYATAVGKPGWETPIGSFYIEVKHKNPVWVVPKSIREEMEEEGAEVKTRVPPGPDNPLGNYWMGTSLPGIGIHATNHAVSIYSYRTHGCVRMYPDAAKDLFHRIIVGEPGMIVYEPVLLAKVGDKIYLEVDPDPYDHEEAEPTPPTVASNTTTADGAAQPTASPTPEASASDETADDSDKESGPYDKFEMPPPTEQVHHLADSNNLGSLIDWRLAAEVIKDQDGLAHDITAKPKGVFGVFSR